MSDVETPSVDPRTACAQVFSALDSDWTAMLAEQAKRGEIDASALSVRIGEQEHALQLNRFQLADFPPAYRIVVEVILGELMTAKTVFVNFGADPIRFRMAFTVARRHSDRLRIVFRGNNAVIFEPAPMPPIPPPASASGAGGEPSPGTSGNSMNLN